jgi:hypothetical protein
MGFCLILSYAKDEVVSTWTVQGLKIDGLDKDWAGAKYYSHKETKTDYAFMSDENNLYILFVFNNPKFLSSVFQKGFTVWVNNEGKKKRNFGINFQRKMIDPETFIMLVERQYKRKLTDKQKEQVRKKKYYTINQSVIVKEGGDDFVAAKVSSKFRPAFKTGQKGKLPLFEIKIPIKDMGGAGFDASPGAEIALNFAWGGMTKQMIKEMRQRRASGAQRAAGLRGQRTQDPETNYGTRIRRIYAGADYSVVSMRKKYSYWVSLVLATKK